MKIEVEFTVEDGTDVGIFAQTLIACYKGYATKEQQQFILDTIKFPIFNPRATGSFAIKMEHGND